MLLTKAFACGIPPQQFWRMSFFELRACLAGHDDGMREWVRLEAWSVANLVNCWVGEDPVTPAELLGEDKPGVPVTSREELRENMARKKRKMRMEDV